jgi:hypothetical protein
MERAADAPWAHLTVIDAMVNTETAPVKLRRVMPLPFYNSCF